MVHQSPMPVNTGFYAVDFGRHIRVNACFPRNFLILGHTVQADYRLTITMYEVRTAAQRLAVRLWLKASPSWRGL